MELHDHFHLWDTHRDDDLFVILPWSLSGVSLGPFNQAHTFWHLDIIMLLLSGYVLLMFGFDPTVDLGDIDHTFDDGWFDVVWFSTYSTSDSILGHISFPVEIYRSSWNYRIVPTYEIHAEMMSCLLSYHDLPREPFFSHSIRLTPFGIWMSSCFSFWETFLWSVDSIQLWTWMAGITHLVMDDLVTSGFLTYHTSDAILGHISVLVEICRSPLICMIIPTYEIHTGLMICFHFVLVL